MARSSKNIVPQSRAGAGIQQGELKGGLQQAELHIDKTAPRILDRDINADEWVKGDQWVGVRSSNVAAIMYKPEDEDLFVTFNNGSIYQYVGVPIEIAHNMFNASSLGKYVRQILVKRGFAYRKIKQGQT